MNVLFITLYPLEANTSVSLSNLGLLRGLRNLGHDITVIMPAVDENASYFDRSNDLSDYKIIRLVNNGLSHKLAAANSNSHGLKQKLLMNIRKVYLKLSLFDRSKSYVNQAKDMPIYDQYFDIVLSTSDPKTSHLFAGECIKNGLKHGKWIQHWGDPLSGDVSSISVYPSWYIKNVERKILSGCDFSFYVSPFTADEQKKNHPGLKDKIGFVPLVCDESYSINSCPTSMKNGDKLKVAFMGDYSSHIRDIMPLYQSCLNSEFVELTIAGNTDIKLSPADNITIYPRLKQADAKEIENSSDVIVSVGNLYGTQIPGKIYYLSASNKHILVTLEEDRRDQMREYIESYGRFITVENNTECIKSALQKLYIMREKNYKTPSQLLPENIVQKMLDISSNK